MIARPKRVLINRRSDGQARAGAEDITGLYQQRIVPCLIHLAMRQRIIMVYGAIK